MNGESISIRHRLPSIEVYAPQVDPPWQWNQLEAILLRARMICVSGSLFSSYIRHGTAIAFH